MIQRLFRYELIAGILCILIPVTLNILDGVERSSISDFAYSDIDFVYVFLITLAATVITTVGIQRARKLTCISGLSLMLVPLTPHMDYPTIHYIASAIFFFGMTANMIINSTLPKLIRYLLVGLMLVCFLAHTLFDAMTVYEAETVGLVIIGTHFVGSLVADMRNYVRSKN